MVRNLFALLALLTAFSCMNQTKTSLTQHPLDQSKSRTLVLENGLKVYLLSDPKFNMSAASNKGSSSVVTKNLFSVHSNLF